MTFTARTTAAQAASTISVLADLWPRAFVVYERRRRPLKIGIDHDIAVAAAGAITADELKAVLRYYVGNLGYLLACREGAERVDLDGNAAGTVTAAEAAHATAIVARRRQNKPAAAKPAPAKPAPAIRDAIVRVIEDDPPMTVRQVFYQLVARGAIEKSDEQYQGTVIRLMTTMRISGDLPFSWVVDESRRVRITRTFDGVEDAIEQTARFYRRSALAQSSDYLEIWVEKDALAGVLWDVTSEYDVPLMVSRGMPSLTFLHSSAQAIRRAAERGKRSFIYQFGDHDPSGVLIPQNIERRLSEMCERLDCPPPIVRRVALTEAQIRRYRLPTRPTKRKGNSHAKDFVGRSVELDALPPHALRDMVRLVIEQHISPAATLALREAENSERKLLRALRPGGAR